MSWVITPAYQGAAVSDADAQTYLRAVETADGQALEPAVARAVNEFVLGCKADGIWTAIKASCILAGARTLNGALVPLVGAAPTNNNFVSGDYNRKTGLVGDGSTKYLNSNRNNSADPQNNSHMSVYVSTAASTGSNFISSGTVATAGNSGIFRVSTTSNMGFASAGSGGQTGNVDFIQRDNTFSLVGLYAHSRSSGSNFVSRIGQTNLSLSIASQSKTSTSVMVFARNDGSGAGAGWVNARLAFYSIGEALDLALLDARITALITAFSSAIP